MRRLLFLPDFDLLREALVVVSVAAVEFLFLLSDSRRLEDRRLFFRLLFVRSAAVLRTVGTAVNKRRNPFP